MNADLIFKAFGEANSDYLIHAEQSMTSSRPMPNRGAKLRFSLIAAAIVAIIMIPLTVIIANHYGITPPPIPVITTPEETYKSLTDIPGAVKVDPLEYEVIFNNHAQNMHADKFAAQLKDLSQDGYLALSGTLSDLSSVIIYDDSGRFAWSVTTAMVTIDQQFITAHELNDTIRIISIYRINTLASIEDPFNRTYVSSEGYYDLAPLAEQTPYGLLSIYPQNYQYSHTIFDENFNPYDYADYMVRLYLPINYYFENNIVDDPSKGEPVAIQRGLYFPLSYFYPTETTLNAGHEASTSQNFVFFPKRVNRTP